jgi:hypothetical protein
MSTQSLSEALKSGSPMAVYATVVSDNENGPKNNNGRTFIDSHLIIPFIRRERQK